MQAIELQEYVRQTLSAKTEGQTLEIKAAHLDCPKRLYDTLSSFSNQDQGGIILFGIDEKHDFALVGVYDLQDLQKKVTEQCKQMEPPVRAVFTTVMMDGVSVCAAEIPGLDLADRPCYYKGAGRLDGSYVRVGDADLKMTDYELYSFEAYRRHQHDDERRIDRASLKMLDIDLINQYIADKRIDRPKFAVLSDEQAMEMLCITRDGCPTLAAVMNFGVYPQGFLPQLAITAIVVPGINIGDVAEDTARFIDNKRIEGTLSEMLEEALAFCKRNMRRRTMIDLQSGKHVNKPEYPIAAIREIILNALIHRDYSHYTEGTPIQINFFENRLEIHSPGGLYGRMTIEQLGMAKLDLRNPALAVMAESQLGSENRYSGIPTIRREMAGAGLPAPVFENRRNEFVVTLYNQPIGETEKTEANEPKDLLAFCRTPRTRSEISAYLGIGQSPYMMRKYVNPLVESGKLRLTMPDKPRSTKQQYVAVK